MGVRTRGLDISVRAKRQVADAAARAEAKAVIDRGTSSSSPRDMLWSPTIRAALIAGTPWLDVFCPGCGTSRAIDTDFQYVIGAGFSPGTGILIHHHMHASDAKPCGDHVGQFFGCPLQQPLSLPCWLRRSMTSMCCFVAPRPDHPAARYDHARAPPNAKRQF
jgi:hypothetical protein